MKKFKITLLISAIITLSACDSTTDKDQQTNQKDTTHAIAKQVYEAISLLGDTLYATKFPEQQQQKYDSALQDAQRAYLQNPNSLYHTMLLGKSLADLQYFQKAIDIYTQAIQDFPNESLLYLHRGNCYMTTRQLNKAIKDLKKCVSLAKNPAYNMPTESQQTMPNTMNLPFTAHYQLGIAYYLSGNYGKAAQQYEKCLKNTHNDQEMAAAADWLYMTYHRLGEDEIAEKTLDVIKDELARHDQEGYFERIMMYKGTIEPEELLRTADSTQQKTFPDQFTSAQLYGVGNYYLSNGDEEKGYEIFNTLINTKYWVAWGYIAAEADLARIKQQIDK